MALSLSLRLDCLNYSTELNTIYINRQNDLREKFTYVIQAYCSRGISRIS